MKDLTKFYDIRGVLRGLAARKAAKNITMKEIKRLEENIIKMETLLLEKSIRRIAKLNIEFHQIIERCSKNRELILLLDNLQKRSRENFSVIISRRDRQKAAIQEHKAIAAALNKKDGILVEKLMKKHEKKTKKALEKEIIFHKKE